MRFSVAMIPWVKVRDRYMVPGYYKKEELNVEQMLERAAKIPGVEGVELNYIHHLTEENLGAVQEALDRFNLKVSCIGVPISGETQWTWGSFTSSRTEARKAAMDRVKDGMDLAAACGAGRINLWNGQDGYDYALEMDYEQAYNLLIEGIKECADYRPDVKLCMEYKLNEPRRRLLNSGIGKALFLIEEINRDNVGILLDFGHAYQARENPAESLYLAARKDRLFHLHLNDNYGFDDDDMMVGAVHFAEYVEFIYWMKRMNYQDWVSLDIFPIREDGDKAAANSIYFLRKIEEFVDRFGLNEFKDLQRTEAGRLYEALWNELFP